MTTPQTLADRRRYLEGGLVDLACDHCGGLVKVRKHSTEQTTVQWTAAAVDGCAEFAMRRAGGQPSALVATCGRLSACIDRAVAEGRLALLPAEGNPVEPAPRGVPPHGGVHEEDNAAVLVTEATS
jgi:hypothetical protein